MADPVIVFNNSTGSDTAASGAGPGDGTTSGSALSGSDASTSGDGLTVTVPNADLSNVLTDGSHVIFVDGATNRKFAKITGKADSGLVSANVTVESAFDASLSGQNYAIGGKRQTLGATDQLYYDNDPLTWILSLETDQTLTAKLDILPYNNGASIQSSEAGTIRTISQSVADVVFEGSRWYLKDLKFQNTSGTPTQFARATNVDDQSVGISAYNCIFGDAVNQFSTFGHTSLRTVTLTLNKCRICHFTGAAFGAGTRGNLSNCIIENCAAFMSSSDLGGCLNLVENCIIKGCSGGSWLKRCGSLQLVGNIFYGNDGHAISVSADNNLQRTRNNIFVNNTFYGISTGKSVWNPMSGNNAFFGNGSGETNNFDTEDENFTLTADPFVDAANDDFTLNDDPGGGAILKAANFSMPVTSTSIYPFGNRTAPGSGSGGGLTIHKAQEILGGMEVIDV